MPFSAQPTSPRDAVLIEFALRGRALHALAESLGRISAELSLMPGSDEACQAMEGPHVTAYLRGVNGKAPFSEVSALVRERMGRIADGDIEVSRLAAIRAFAGPSASQPATYHYVVRTDVAPGGENELERWYDEEHMPKLASVPGVVMAQRLVSLDAGPKYYACYDLVSPDTLKSAPWQAARGTDWSERVRPTFRHTRRIISRRLLEIGL